MVVTLMDALYPLAAVVVGVLSVARLTRLIVLDTWPPVVALREWWDRRTVRRVGSVESEGPWYALVSCPYCASPYITAVVLGWGVLSELHWSWWIVNGWLAAAYVAALIVVKDGE